MQATSDAREVLALQRAQQYDLVVLDLNMPHMSGFEVLEQLQQAEGRCLPVLVMTAAPELKLRALEAGARDFVSKPFDALEVLSRIRNLLEVRLLYTGTRDYGLRLERYDALTGLPNRSLFLQLLQQNLGPAALPGGVLLVDLDGFKYINDTLGHEVGDAVLRQSAERLSWCAPGAVVARVGNDEFALLQQALEAPEQASRLAGQIRRALAAPFQCGPHEVSLTASIGIALYPGDTEQGGALLTYADTALYQAKAAGSDSDRFFTDTMNLQMQRRFELEHALRKALEHGEFELVYQPKVALASGAMVGAEALLRWNRPGHGMVSPADFVPLLEQTGLIVPVGAWVIEAVCQQLGQWARSGAEPVPVAVNVASRQFAVAGLEAAIGAALATHQVAPALLALEVTESALMQDPERSAALLGRLRAGGMRVAVDDFGTGYSSLAYLKRFPVDTLKIDIAFIREVTHNPDDAALVDAIIAMAHSLRLEVVAEGVENAAQLAYLARRRCDQIQGYYFSRPVCAAQFGQMLREGRRLALPDGRDQLGAELAACC